MLDQVSSNGLFGDSASIQSPSAQGAIALETRYDCKAYDPSGNLLWEETAYNRVVTVGLNKLLDATFKTGLTTPLWYIGIIGPELINGVCSSGSSVVTSASNPWLTTGQDDGRAIIVKGAAGGGADLVTTISTATAVGSISLTVSASTSLTNVSMIWDARSTDTSTAHSPWTESSAYSTSRPAFTPGTVAAGSVDNSGSPASYAITANTTVIGGMLLANSSSVGSIVDLLYGMAPFSSVGFRTLNSGDTLQVTATLTAVSA